MANTITTQTLTDGTKSLTIGINIFGDGSGEESNTVLIDASSYLPAFTDVSLCGVVAALVGFSATLAWEATVNTPLMSIAGGPHTPDLKTIGCIPNQAGVGKTGNILITTYGLGSNDHGTLILSFDKHYNNSKNIN